MSRDGWVKGKALQTVIALRGIQRGDEVQCSNPDCLDETHTILDWPANVERPEISGRDGSNVGSIALNEIVAWRPRTK